MGSAIASPNQWAYKQGWSTELLLLHLKETWKHTLDSGKIIGVLFIDFQKAFESIDHKIPKEKLKQIGAAGGLYNILGNYLEQMKQYAVVGDQRSDMAEVKFGVPQGSLLGPRFFAAQENDLPKVPSKGTLNMYADDPEYFYIGSSIDEVMQALQQTVIEIAAWCSNNSMTKHPKKSEIMIITNKKFVGPLNMVKLGENDIEVVAKSKCLGVTIDYKISWKAQVVNAAASKNKKIKQLKMFQSISPQVLEEIYFQSILPAATYGIAVWGSGTFLAPLERIHKRAAKLVHKLPKSLQDHKILETVNLKSVE